jgi:hypothetical protein
VLPLLLLLLVWLQCLTTFFGVAVLLGLLKLEFDLRVTWIAVTPAKGW